MKMDVKSNVMKEIFIGVKEIEKLKMEMIEKINSQRCYMSITTCNYVC
jgi:hypothetical protein